VTSNIIEKKIVMKKMTKKNKNCFNCGQTGHLAKVCPISTANEPKLTYIPPKRIQFKSSNDVKEFKERIQAFKYDSHQHPHLQPKLYQPILKELLFYLTIQYKHLKNFMLNPSQVKLAFTNNF